MLARLKREDGANAVEFALVLPILIVLLFGILYGGIAYNRQLALTQAAREGARFGATLPFSGTAPGSDWFEAVRERTLESSTGSLNAADAGICIRFVDPDEDATAPDGDCGVDASSVQNRARVEIAVERPAVLDLIFYSFPVTIRSESISRYEPEIDAS